MRSSFDGIYADLLESGKEIAPRGAKTLELLDYAYTLDPDEVFPNYPSRNLSIPYIKEELKWYLRGDPTDLSICAHAKIWEGCVQDGRINSNYGYYLFAQGGLRYAVNCLRMDPDSRRAVVPILGAQHLRLDSKDTPCTVSLGYRIRDGKVLSTVHMRSQDAIYGLGNDVPFFSLCHQIVAAALGVPRGGLTVFVESLHVYEKHFAMLERLVTESVAPVHAPVVTESCEAEALLRGVSNGPLREWLHEA